MSKLKRVAIIANEQVTGVKGGAEIFHEKLYESVKKYVPDTELIRVPCNELTYEDILRSYETCYSLDLSRFDGVISSKAPTFAVTHPNHVCYLMHTVRVFYDMFDEAHADKWQQAQRELIFRLDRELLAPPRTKKVFSIGQEVTDRSLRYTGIHSTPLHPGITSEGFYCAEQGDYLYLPGRLHKWKRVDLAVKAMKYVTTPVKLKIAGTGDMLDELRALAGDNANIEFLGYVSDDEMRRLYASALGTVFCPMAEDYGYILHESFKSDKPVITCTDSGEPARFLRHGENGYLSEPEPKKIAHYMDMLYQDRENAARMGKNGHADIAGITWDAVAQTLIQALKE